MAPGPETGGGTGGYPAARLRLLQDGSRSGPTRRAALARLTDDWLAGLLVPHPAVGHPTGVALAAVGGYGRGELSPHSDLDLLLLHDGDTPHGEIAALADRVWYPVWDLGLALDHAVRTVDEARQAAAEDLRAQLGLLDIRHLAGDPTVTAEVRTAVLGQWRAQAPTRLPELHELCQERAHRVGELPHLLEPDLKEARGGLRDATALRAVAASWLADAPRRGLEEARAALLDIRDVLHLTTGRATDRLAFQDQDPVAAERGLADADALLRQVHEAARTIAYASDVTWREVTRVLQARPAPSRPRPAGAAATHGPWTGMRLPLAEGVVEQDGEAVLARTARPDRDPVLTLRAAAAAAQAGLPLAPPAVRRLAAGYRSLPVPWPAEAREQFVTLLGAAEGTVPVWAALEAEGLVSRLLPEWERVRCRPQRDPVHRWTVDRHLVETAVRAAGLTRRVRRPDLLLIAAFLHDIGKGWPGDHSVVGAPVARELAWRIGYGTEDAEVIGTLVRHHLLLMETATRRDLDDPATVRSVADAVSSADTLELLHALTEADALATGPGAWSAWRASLVADLVRRVGAQLAGRVATSPGGTGRPTAEQRRLLRAAWRTRGLVLTLRAQPEAPSPRRAPAASGSAAAPRPAEASGAPHPAWPAGSGGPCAPEPVGAELLVALPDRPGVLPAVAGVLALHRLTVRTADLREFPAPAQPPGGTVAGGVLLLRWRVAAEFGPLPRAALLRADLVRTLEGTLDVSSRLAERARAHRRRRRGPPAPPPRVVVAPAGSESATVVEVRAQDVPGLLHRIGRVLEFAGVRVRSAHVGTLGANAVDAFYLTGPQGERLSPCRAAELARELERTLAG